jgi:Tol biopolymer transport system component
MGEVYRARDTRLDRTVAIKVLPSRLSLNSERRQRLEREAKTISSLNHPHICTLHDIGCQDGVDFLVMEYLDGETLAARLEKGPLAMQEVLRYGVEIADALDKAHRQGVIHRDLKPSNIILTKAGAKLLDFGLAKASTNVVAAAVSQLTAELRTESQPLTAEGTIVGTIQYMAPEQLEGKEADARSDIFSFGCVLYEMATGRKAFSGKSQATIIAAILSVDPPPISSLQPLTPPSLSRVVKKCLAKEPDERWQTAHDLRDELKWIAEDGSRAGVPAPVAKPRRTRERLGWVLAAAVLLPFVATLAVTVVHLREKPVRGLTVRFHFALPENVAFGWADFPVVSPDGERIAFTAVGADGQTHLWVRPLDSLSSVMLPGTEGAYSPFWSPASKSIAFLASRELKRIDLSGGQPETLCDVQGFANGAWSQDEVILLGRRLGTTGPLYRVSAAGGEPKPVSELDPSRPETYQAYQTYPQFLPDGHHFLYFAGWQQGHPGIYVSSLDSKESKRVLDADSKAVYTSGYLLYMRGTTLTAQKFDWKRRELAGAPVPVGQQVAFLPEGAFSVSQNGILAYRTGSGGNTELTWFDRHGNRGSTAGPPAEYSNPSLSPDGSRLAVSRMDPQTRTRDLWVFDLKRGTSSRLTYDPADDLNPVWSLDGSRIFFTSDRKGQRDIYEKPANGIGNEAVVLESKQGKNANDISLDGRYLIYDTSTVGTSSRELWILPLFGDRKPFLFVQGNSPTSQAQFSPNGHFIAYTSNETGRYEVYVQTFPEARGKWQVSIDGGSEATWRHDGKELFYISQKKLMSVEVKTDANSLQAGIPKSLFEVPLLPARSSRNHYVVTWDGQRFLFNVAAEGAEASMINVAVNWPAALRK